MKADTLLSPRTPQVALRAVPAAAIKARFNRPAASASSAARKALTLPPANVPQPEQSMRTTASRKSRIRLVRIGVGTGIGLALGFLMTGCPADVTGSTVPVPGGLVGITVAPASGPVSGGTVVTFTSVNGGFDARTSVLFGADSATEVRVYNANVMTAVAPPVRRVR
jgi:hypothetical protein